MEFEVIDIVKGEQSFTVTVELENKTRQGFAFPYEDHWFVEENGEPKWLNHIKSQLKRATEQKKKKSKKD